MEKIRSVVEKILEVFLVFLLGFICLLVFANVVARYVFRDTITWAFEVARFGFIWLTFLGAALGMSRGTHIGMDILTSLAGPRTKKVLMVISSVFIMIFLVVWFRFGFRLVELNRDFLGSGSGISLGLVYLVGPISGVLMAFFLVLNLIRDLRPGATTPPAGTTTPPAEAPMPLQSQTKSPTTSTSEAQS